ncbi:MAG: AMP-binding protein [Gammaproteobacteria bacterium]|nr:AMP-binding protein [Gammaproteobacteria bacterium]
MSEETVWSLVDRRAATTPEMVFAIDENDCAITFREFRDEAIRAARSLKRDGIKTGMVVSWILPSWIETLVLICALSRIGAIQNPIVPILREREVGFIVRQTRAQRLITPGLWRQFDYAAMASTLMVSTPGLSAMTFERRFDDAPEVSDASSTDDSAVRWYFYSSGTTSDPKGAKHTDRSLIASAWGMVDGLELTDRDRLPIAFPVSHIGGTIYLIASMLSGCSLSMTEAFHPVETLDQFSRQGITLGGPGAPFLLAFIRRQRELGSTKLFPKVRAFLSGGAPKSPTLEAEVQETLGAPLLSCYGLTEAPMLTYNRVDDEGSVRAATEGRATSGVDLALFVGDRRVPAGEEGEVRVKGTRVMCGYLDESLNADTFDAAGYLRTGDLGRMDAQGNLTITGRIKEIIIRNMENISATEVEGLLHTHPQVRDVAVIGLPDVRTGERVCAVIVPVAQDDAPTGEVLCQHLLQQGLSRRKTPEQFEYVAELPRNPMGKVLKAELKVRYGKPAAAA